MDYLNTQKRQIKTPQTSGRWCLCLHNLSKTMVHMWAIKWDEIMCYWQWVVMTEQDEKKKSLIFLYVGAKLAPVEEEAGCLFVAKMPAFLPVELEPIFFFQKKKALYGWQWFNWDGLLQPLGCESWWGCQWSVSAEEICLLQTHVYWELDQALVHWQSCLWERQSHNCFFFRSWICNDFPPSGCVGRRNKGAKLAHPKEGIPDLDFLVFIRFFLFVFVVHGLALKSSAWRLSFAGNAGQGLLVNLAGRAAF